MNDSATNHRRGVFAPGHLGELTQLIPPEMVDAALATAGGKEQRLRRLPSRVVVYLLLAGALFAGQGWRHVFSRLTAGLAAPAPRPSGAAITGAMRRVGPKPLRELFTFFVGSALTGATGSVRFAGHLVVAIDGTQIAVPDTEANRVMFPKPPGGPNGEAGYPMIRLVAIIASGSRSVIEAVFGSDKVGELAYAEQVARALRPGMLLLGDRNFATYKFFATIAGSGAGFLIRGKTGHGAMKLPVATVLRDGSYLATAGGVPVRVIDAEVTIATAAGIRTSDYRLITTVLDPGRAPAKQLVDLYHRRWEIETAYCELKSTILGGRVLRSRYPSGIEQEMWALLTVYQVLRTAMSDATLARADIGPGRTSFTVALRAAQDQVVLAAGIMAQSTVDLVGRVGSAVLANLMPVRGARTRIRVVKRAISKYRAKGRDVDRRTYPATLSTIILPPDPNP